MAKKIIIGIVTAVFFAGLLFGFLHFRRLKTPSLDALHSIPQTAAVIIRANDMESLLAKISDGNLIWDELLSVSYFQKLNKDLHFIDSIVKNNTNLREVVREKPVFLSFHRKGSGKADYLVSLSFPPSAREKSIHQIIQQAARGAVISNSKFDGVNITHLKLQEGQFHYAFHKGIFILSPSGLLLENAVQAINHDAQKIIYEKAFNEVYTTANENVNANIFINYKNFAPFSANILKEEADERLKPFQGFANWAAMDIAIRPNLLMLNGFSFSYDTIGNYLNLFKKQKPQPIEATRIMPASTATMLYFGFSNFSAYYQSFRNFQGQENAEKEEKAIRLIEKYGNELEINLFSWVSNEVAVLVTGNSEENNFREQSFAIFKAANIEQALKQLGEIHTGSATETFNDFEIKALPVENAYHLLLGEAFANIQSPYYTNIGKYIVIGNSPDALKYYLNEFEAERTLQKDAYYQVFSEDLSSDANIFVYANISNSLDFHRGFLTDWLKEFTEENDSLLRKFQAFAFQLNSNDELFYHNLVLKYNPDAKQENITLWETQLDTTVSTRPRIVHNHLTNTKEIFVQDDGNTIYLISNTGKILWKKSIDGPVLGDPHQIDIFKNEKLQLLFNTREYLYLLDRNGNLVDKFPVKLPELATAPLALMDYEGKKDYRILIPLKDNKIYNFSAEGEPVKGFAPVMLENQANLSVQHIEIGGKDLLFAVDTKGKVYVFDRKGDPRARLKEKLPFNPNSVFYIEKGKDLAKTFITTTDSSGVIFKLNLLDELEKLPIQEFSAQHKVDFKDIDADKVKEYIFLDQRKLYVFNTTKQKVFSHEFKNPIPQPTQYFLFPDGKGKIGVTDPKAEEIYLFDEAGNLFYNFPLRGATGFSIGNINQGNGLNLVTGAGRNIFLYQIKH
jgi:hypothetical protein